MSRILIRAKVVLEAVYFRGAGDTDQDLVMPQRSVSLPLESSTAEILEAAVQTFAESSQAALESFRASVEARPASGVSTDE